MTKDIKLLNHQFELMSDTTTKILGLVTGFGAGKTYVACRKAIQLSYLNLGATGIITEPTHPMLRDIFIPEMKIALEEWEIKYNFNASNSIFTLFINGYENKILCMSTENVSRLVGVNAAFAICDEFDTSRADLSYKAYLMLLGRLRAGSVRQFVITTTGEGFKSAYRIFVTEKDENKKLIQAETYDNKYLPDDYIETLESQYPAELLEAYLKGKFVNLTSGTVYSYFNRKTHDCDTVSVDNETLMIGQDFNINACITIVAVQRGDEIHIVDEIVSYDTKAIIANISRRYPKNAIACYPDASGNNRKTSAQETDIAMLRQANFMIYANSRNPSVIDRVNCVNNQFEKNKLKVNVSKCPELTKALERQAWKNGEPEKQNTHPEPSDYNDALGYIISYKKPIIKPLSKAKLSGI